MCSLVWITRICALYVIDEVVVVGSQQETPFETCRQGVPVLLGGLILGSISYRYTLLMNVRYRETWVKQGFLSITSAKVITRKVEFY